MKRMLMVPLLASVALAGCASDPYGRYGDYGYNDRYYDDRYDRGSSSTARAAKGAVIGAAAGAAVGAVVDGVSVEEGAIGGAAAGAIAGLVIKGKRYYRDRDGYCYYVKDGYREYDYDVRC